MAGRHRAQRRGNEVGGKGQVVDLGQIGDLPALRQPSAFGNVGHDDVGALLLHEFAEAPAQIEVLADADGSLAAHPYLFQRFNIFRRDRLFQPHQVEALHFRRYPAGAGNVIARVQVDAQVNVRPDGLAHRSHPLHHGAQLCVVDGVVDRVELRRMVQIVDVEFERGKPLADHPPGPGRATLCGAGRVVAVAAIGVEADAVAKLAAKHPVERLARCLGCDIPQGHLQPGQGNQEDTRLRTGKDVAAPDFLPAIVDIAGVLANQLGFQLGYQSHDRGGSGIGVRLSET